MIPTARTWSENFSIGYIGHYGPPTGENIVLNSLNTSYEESKSMMLFCLYDFGFIEHLSKYSDQRERSIFGAMANNQKHSVKVVNQVAKKPQYKLRTGPRSWDRNLPAIRAEQRNSAI